MRTLGFRAMWEDLNDSEGDTWCDTDQIEMSEFFQLLEDGKIDKNTLGQKTGLTDRNGVEIYEGDILRFYSPVWRKYITAEIKWMFDPTMLDCEGEVIGNIYEHGHLLGTTNDQL